MIGVDTNVLVRYLAQDDRVQAAQATRFFETILSPDEPGYVPTIVLAELVWVLEGNYAFTRDQVATLVDALLRTRQLRFQDTDSASQALGDFKAGKADYVDCLVQRLGAAAGCGHTVTFDRVAARLPGMRLLGS